MTSTYRLDLDALTIFLVSSPMTNLGYYVASDEQAAINAMLADAGHDGAPSPDLVATEWDDFEQAAAEADEHGDGSGAEFYRAAAKGDRDAMRRIAEMLSDAADADVADDE